MGKNNGGTIINCYSVSCVKGSIDTLIAGGLVGGNYNSGVIENCYSTGLLKNIPGNNNVGGLLGYHDGTGSIISCYWDIETSGQTSSAGGIGKSTLEMKQQVTYIGWNFTNIWAIDDGSNYPYLQISGQTQPLSPPALVPIEIWSIEDLSKIGTDLNYPSYGDYIIMTDIDASDTENWNNGKGFKPIPYFYGNLEGNNHTITNLFINSSVINLNWPALAPFSRLVVASIRNLTLKNVRITNEYGVGGLAGILKLSELENCHVEGKIRSTNNNMSGYTKAGGLFWSSTRSTIKNCSFRGTIGEPNINMTDTVGGLGYKSENDTILNSFVDFVAIPGVNQYIRSDSLCINTMFPYSLVGGLIAEANGSTISGCYTNGLLWGVKIGGLIGIATDVTISNCYSISKICSYPINNVIAGGLVAETKNTTTIMHCYAGGKFAEEIRTYSRKRGLVGRNYGTLTIVSSYWDTESTGINVSDGGGEPKNTQEMFQQNTFSNWDFVNIWNIDEGNSYPYLRALPPVILPVPENLLPLIEIWSLEELTRIGNDPRYPINAHYVLMTTIDASVTSTCDNGKGFKPIEWFAGTFDGNGNAIQNLYINRQNESNLGLFGNLMDAEVKNLTLSTINVNGKGPTITLGSIVGVSFLSTIQDCIANDVVISAQAPFDNIGGLIGKNVSGIVRRCATSGILECNTIDEGKLGGISGYNGGLVEQCYSTCTIVNGLVPGGIVGLAFNEKFYDVNSENCYCSIYNDLNESYFAGQITGSIPYVGGLIGVSNCTGVPPYVDRSYWDIMTSGVSTSFGGGEGKTTTQMKTQSTYSNWDFDNVWFIQNNISYPVLRSLDRPEIHIVGDTELTIECGEPYNDPGATATDGLDGDLTGSIQTINTVNEWEPGTYYVIYSVSDTDGNTTVSGRRIAVVDTIPPQITLFGPSLLIHECHTPFIDPGAEVQDECDLNVDLEVLGSVDIHTVGDYTLTYIAQDASGNLAQVQRIVRVEDNPPIIQPVSPPTNPFTIGKPIQFIIEYIGVSEVTLGPEDVELIVQEGDVSAEVEVNRLDTKLDGNVQYEIILYNFEGNGVICVHIKPGTAVDGSGNYAPEFDLEPCITVQTGPTINWGSKWGLTFAIILLLIHGWVRIYNSIKRVKNSTN